MAVRKIIRMGHPTLRRRARRLRPEELTSGALHRLVSDMVDTLHDYGGIGLAAPQVNESVRLALVEIPGGPTRYGELDHMPLTICINPEIEIVDETAAGYWEGCLSIPGLRGFVERPQHIRVRHLDLKGEQHAIEARDFLATVFQHEFDHLDGRLFVDRIQDPTRLAFEEEFARYLLPSESDGESAASAG